MTFKDKWRIFLSLFIDEDGHTLYHFPRKSEYESPYGLLTENGYRNLLEDRIWAIGLWFATGCLLFAIGAVVWAMTR